ALVAERLGDRQSAEGDAQSRAGRLVHLPVDEGGRADHARFGHLDPEVVALARPLADAGEDGSTLVLGGDVVDELLDEDGLAEAGAPAEPDLAALDERRDQVDDLHAGLVDLDRRLELAEVRRVAVDLRALDVLPDGIAVVDRLSDHVEDTAERRLPDWHLDRPTGVDDVHTAREAVRRVHCDSSDAVVAEVLLDLRNQLAGFTVFGRDLDAERAVDL